MDALNNISMRLLCKYKAYIIITFSVFASSACAMFYDLSTNNKPAPYTKPTTIAKNFDISGRFIIKANKKNNYGNFTWSKQDDDETMELRSPIGSTIARITIKDKIATLATGNKIYTGDNLDQLLEDNLGFILPIGLLHYWIQGVALPNIPLDNQLGDGFTQLGWVVEYLSWSDATHPKVIQCSKGDLTIKLLLEWD